MLSSEEILEKLYRNAIDFSRDVHTKKYDKAVYAYEAARNIARYMELDEATFIELFGTRQTDVPIEGLYSEELALKAQMECILKNKTMREITMEEKRQREAEWRKGIESKGVPDAGKKSR